jgi:hypothetical protein
VATSVQALPFNQGLDAGVITDTIAKAKQPVSMALSGCGLVDGCMESSKALKRAYSSGKVEDVDQEGSAHGHVASQAEGQAFPQDETLASSQADKQAFSPAEGLPLSQAADSTSSLAEGESLRLHSEEGQAVATAVASASAPQTAGEVATGAHLLQCLKLFGPPCFTLFLEAIFNDLASVVPMSCSIFTTDY